MYSHAALNDQVTLTRLRQVFPSLQDFTVTSPQDWRYNCIAWAAGIDTNWWWPVAPPPPDHHPLHHWPPGVPKTKYSSSFIFAFSTLGYEPCDDDTLEDGFEKVAIYIYPQGDVSHMARQKSNGRWTSKIGEYVDIDHASPGELEGQAYGKVLQYMRRVHPTSECIEKTS